MSFEMVPIPMNLREILFVQINNKCLFKGILVRRIFHMYSFQLLTFEFSFTPSYKCHHRMKLTYFIAL